MIKTVDLRSDTVTQPTSAMRAAMAGAPVGDDVFGDDPSINALQDKLANMLGFEAALFVPTGTQSNLCGLMAHCQRGDEYIVGQMAHTYRWEGGGAAVLGSIQPQPLEHQADGTLALADIEAAIKPDDAHFARTRLLTLENTFGGKLLPLDYVQAATDLAKNHGLARHLDGARLFNAAVAQATQSAEGYASNRPQALMNKGPEAITYDAIVNEARRIAQCFDSVSVCLSKGLGAPVGSALCGSADFITRAHRIRKMVGGGMRQAGMLAAAGSYALDHHVARLADDHALARRLADGLQGLPGVVVEPPQTNIVFVDLVDTAKSRGAELLPYLTSHGVLATGLYRLRFVTHLDVDAAGIDHAVSVIRAYFEHH
ncbi:aminotransferase class I/II-fold pyridoxal phosphate-dependent enzyme [Rhodoferax sp. U2-2l]|uniref:GntG family PLP-dependent aldolase n=1 Tax=Rhodoferax sp. U2-2l TaxID=2884000 RepID=UPI001D0AD6D1|nr:GntG family PLP-dependent aldolase [Rhodoferax sp. U2-2l]MCB8748122.1 aminotransferase class I/II-fold pyridoxal phosphate-dependent enzyme [Rhodoferax sp. U2-2l]